MAELRRELSSGVQHALLSYRERHGIHRASWERIAEETVELARIRAPQAKQLLEARLESFFEPYMTIEPLKRIIGNDDPLFPLGEKWLEARIGDAIDLKPPPTQDQIEELIDKKVDLKIREQIKFRQLERDSFPPDGANMLGLTASLLKQCLGRHDLYTLRSLERPRPVKTGNKPIYDLMVKEQSPDGKEVFTGVSFVSTGSATSAAEALRRMQEDDDVPHHIVLVTEERPPLHLGAKGQEYLDKLRERGESGFLEMTLTFDQYAQLDALEAVVGQANSGDLEAELPHEQIHAISPSEVVASNHRCDRYRSHILLNELLTEEPFGEVGPVAKIKVDERDMREFVRGAGA